MADEQLKVSISGDASGLEKASQVAASALNKIDKSAVHTSNTLSNLPKVSAQVSSAASTMARSAATAGGAIAKTTTNFTGLSRVIQDLPFGFIAISNNLEQLLPAAGAAGLAFSAIVAALSFAQIGFQNWIRGSKGVNDASDKIKKKLEETKERIAELTKSFSDIKIDIKADVVGDTTAEITKVQALSKVVTDVTKSYNDRNAALNQLKDINKNYFGDLTLETDKLSTLTSRVDEYTKALVAAAVVKAFSEDLGKVGKELSIQDDKLSDLRGQLNAIAGDYQLVGKQAKGVRLLTPQQNQDAENLRKQIKEQEPLVTSLGNTFKKLQEQVKGAVLETLKFKPLDDTKDSGGKKIKDNNDKIKDALEERKRIIAEFSKDFAEISIATLPDVGDPKDNKELFERLRKRLESEGLRQLPVKIKLPVDVTITQDFKTGKIDITEILKEVQGVAEAKFKNLPPLKIPISIQMDIDKAAEIAAKIKAYQELIKNTISSAVTDIATEGFSGIGEAIGAALSGNDMGNVFQSFFNFLGGAISQLGKQMIALSPVIAALKAAIKTLNPALLLPAGIALVTIGAALKNITVKGFAKGGMVPGQGSGDTVPAMLTPGEFVVTKDKAPFIASLLKAMGNGIKLPKISNNSFHFSEGGFVPQGVASTTPLSRINNIVTSQNTITMPQGDWRIRGKDLVFVMAQTQKHKGGLLKCLT
jgi:archaellum component FlaC